MGEGKYIEERNTWKEGRIWEEESILEEGSIYMSTDQGIKKSRELLRTNHEVDGLVMRMMY